MPGPDKMSVLAKRPSVRPKHAPENRMLCKKPKILLLSEAFFLTNDKNTTVRY